MTKPKSKRRRKFEITRVSYFWADPVRPPIPPPYGWKEGQPFLEADVLGIPRPGDPLSIQLPGPVTVGFSPAVSKVHGRVVRTEQIAPGHVRVLIKREGRVGLGWDELCAFIGANAVGYHDAIGRVEGEIVGLHPAAELAGLRVPALRPAFEAVVRRQVEMGIEDPDTLESLDDDPVIWVSWSSLLPASVIDFNPVDARSATFPPLEPADPPPTPHASAPPSGSTQRRQPSPLSDYETFAAALDAARKSAFPAGPGEPCFVLAAFEGASALARRYSADAERPRGVVYCDAPMPSKNCSRKTRDLVIRLLRAFGSDTTSTREDSYEMEARLRSLAARSGVDLLIVASLENFVTPARHKPLLREFYQAFAYLKSAALADTLLLVGDDPDVVDQLVTQDAWMARRIRLLRGFARS